MLEKPTRRGFITGLGSLFIAAPAIVRASSLMPIKALSSDLMLDEALGYTAGDVYSLGRIRELLLPGLWQISGSYPAIPKQWDSLFRAVHDGPAVGNAA